MLNELDQPTFIEVVVGRDGSRGESSCARPPSQNPSSGFPATGSPGCAREMAIRLRLRSDLVRLCGHLSPTSECRECFPRPATQPAPPLPHVRGFPALRVLSASPTSTVASVSLRLVHSVDILGPLPPSQDSGGSPRCHDASISVRAVLLDPAGVSNDHRPLRSLTVAFQVFDPVGLRMCHEAQSLHLRCWDRTRARRCEGEGLPVSPFRLRDGITISPTPRFPRPPDNPGRPSFSGPVRNLGFPPWVFPAE